MLVTIIQRDVKSFRYGNSDLVTDGSSFIVQVADSFPREHYSDSSLFLPNDLANIIVNYCWTEPRLHTVTVSELTRRRNVFIIARVKLHLDSQSLEVRRGKRGVYKSYFEGTPSRDEIAALEHVRQICLTSLTRQ